MPKYKTDRPFTEEQLEAMDVIHDPNTKMFKCQYEDSYVVEDFINGVECGSLDLWFRDNYPRIGYDINDHVYHITFPMLYEVVSDIVRPKIYDHFGNDVIFYSDVSKDPMSVGDQFFKSKRPYGLHTDAVTHLEGYRPYKDIIIPIALEGIHESQYVTFNQRYRGRATHFMKGRIKGSFANYANVIRHQDYEEYGVGNSVTRFTYWIIRGARSSGTPSWKPGESSAFCLPARLSCAVSRAVSCRTSPISHAKTRPLPLVLTDFWISISRQILLVRKRFSGLRQKRLRESWSVLILVVTPSAR